MAGQSDCLWVAIAEWLNAADVSDEVVREKEKTLVFLMLDGLRTYRCPLDYEGVRGPLLEVSDFVCLFFFGRKFVTAHKKAESRGGERKRCA